MKRIVSLALGAVLVAGGALVAVPGPASTAVAASSADRRTAGADFDGDGWADLATTVNVEVSNDVWVTRIHVLYGGRSGFSTKRADTWVPTDFDPKNLDNALWAETLATGDFDADGYDDLAISGTVRTGIRILYGSRRGLGALGSQRLGYGLLGSNNGANLLFGTSLVAGSFGRGKADDLAIGGPYSGSGAVLVLYGSSRGLVATGRQVWRLTTPGIRRAADPGYLGSGGDGFGDSLAAGRFAGGAYDDLAIGAPGEPVGRKRAGGAVHVLRGSARGLQVAGNQVWTQDSAGIGEIAEINDDFGAVLTTGDFQADGRDDLVISTPDEFIGRVPGPVSGNQPVAGLVHVLYGSTRGLTARGAQVWSQNSRGVKGVSEDFDRFGTAVAVGQFGRDPGKRRYADLAIGVPGEDLGYTTLRGGGVHVLYGSKRGLTAKGDQFWTQDSRGVKGISEYSDGFGQALSVGQYGRDRGRRGQTALAVAAPNEALGDIHPGGINVLYATSRGLRAAHDEFLDPRRLPSGGKLNYFGRAFATN